MTEIEIFRQSELIDPTLHIWGWEIPVYLFLGGITAGLMILTAILGRGVARDRMSTAMRWLPFAAPILLSVGMFALLLDLELKAHLFRFYTAFRITSPMSWGAWILLLIYPSTLLLGLARLSDIEFERITSFRLTRALRLDGILTDLREWASTSLDRLSWANVVLGIGLGTYTGVLLGTLGARALWSSTLLGPLFLVSGLSTGAAFMMLFPVSREEHHALVKWDIGAILVEIALIARFFIDLTASKGLVGREAVAMFLGGSYTAPFWSLVIITGLVVPLALEISERVRRLAPSIAAPALLLVGGLALRWILVTAGQAM
jgi:formate-dependent nitrite reductase membrane component NrfD